MGVCLLPFLRSGEYPDPPMSTHGSLGVGPPAHEAQGRVGDEGGGVKDELRGEAEEGGT